MFRLTPAVPGAYVKRRPSSGIRCYRAGRRSARVITTSLLWATAGVISLAGVVALPSWSSAAATTSVSANPKVLRNATPSNSVDVLLTTGNHKKLAVPSNLPLTPMTKSSGTRITLDPAERRQTIDGFGATLTDSSASELMRLSAAERNSVMSHLFNPKSGAGISIIRIPMGANDFSPHDFTYDDNAADESSAKLPHFSIFNDPDMRDIITLLRQAAAINPKLVIIASPWTAPAWMKTHDTYYGCFPKPHSLKACPRGDGVTLKQGAYREYAAYFVKFIQAAAANHINVNYVTPQNEPMNPTTSYPGMVLSATEESDFVSKYLSPALSSAHLRTQVLGYDHNWSDTSYPSTVLADAHSVTGTAWHCYAGNATSESAVESKHPHKLNFITECSGTGPDYTVAKNGVPNYTDFANNLDWDSRNLIVGGLNNWASGAQLYNLALDQNCGPQIAGVTKCVDPSPAYAPCEDCRGVVTIDAARDAVADNVEYYLLSEASAAFSAGAVDIGVNTPSSLQAAAALNTDGSTGLYVSNSSGNSVTFSVVENAGNAEGFTYTIQGHSVASFRWSSTYLVGLNTLCQDPGATNDSVNGCPYDGETGIGSASFSYAAYVDDNDSSVYPSYWDLLDFPAGSCHSVRVSFGIPNSGGAPGDSVYLKVSDGADSYAGTAQYGNLETFDAPLNGQAWSVYNSGTNADDQIAINMVATCGTATGSSG